MIIDHQYHTWSMVFIEPWSIIKLIFSYASSSTLYPVSEWVIHSFGLQPSSVAWSLRACWKETNSVVERKWQIVDTYLGMIASLCQLLLSLVHMVHWRRPCSVVTCASAKSVLRMGAAQSRVRAGYNGWQRRAPNFVRNNVRNNSIRPPCKLQNSGLKSNFFTFQMQAFI